MTQKIVLVYDFSADRLGFAPEISITSILLNLLMILAESTLDARMYPSYNQLADYYKKQYNSTEQEATEYALLGKLSNSITLIKVTGSGPYTSFLPLELGPVPNNPKMPQPVRKKDC